MIDGAHVIIYSRDAAADRRFLWDVVGLGHVDAGDGWLILKAPPAEIAVHPTEGAGSQELYFPCDDIHATVDEPAAKGVQLTAPEDQGWGVMCTISLPGGGQLGLYEPRHPTAFDL